MKTLITIVSFFIMIPSFAQHGIKNFIDQNYIEVTGKAEMEITPDEIYVRIYITEEALKHSKSIEEAEAKMIKILTAEGIDVSKDLKIKDMASNLTTYWLKKDQVTSTKEYQLMLCDAETTVTVFRKLKPLGITNISIDHVDHSKLKQFKEEVRINAIKIAKHKAEVLTTAIGQTCGSAMYINELSASQGSFVAANANILVEQKYSLDKSRFESTPVLQLEKIRLESTMHVKFKIS